MPSDSAKCCKLQHFVRCSCSMFKRAMLSHVLGILQQETTLQTETRRQCGPKESWREETRRQLRMDNRTELGPNGRKPNDPDRTWFWMVLMCLCEGHLTSVRSCMVGCTDLSNGLYLHMLAQIILNAFPQLVGVDASRNAENFVWQNTTDHATARQGSPSALKRYLLLLPLHICL